MSAQQFRQLEVSEQEKARIARHIEDNVRSARDNHDARNYRFRRYYRMWRGLQETQGTRENDAFQYPMLKWITFGQWARIMQALLGDDAEIIAIPASPIEEKDSRKAGHFMTWRFFRYMQATIGLSTWVFRALIFGRAHAELIYEQEYYWERDPETGEDKEVLTYDGPRLRPLWPSQLILPAQDNVESIDDFEWKCRRDRVTPQQLLDDERRGKVTGIRDNWEALTAASQERQERNYEFDNEREDADEAEGVQHGSIMGNRNSLERWRWYGKWRLPKGKQEARVENLSRRQDVESDLMITYLPDVQMVVGIQDLRDIYPRMRKRHPFVDLGAVKDGSYWTPGLGELVEDLQKESSINYSVFRKAGMLSVGPIIFFKPSSGFDPEAFEYRPGTAIPTENPEGVKTIEMRANLEYPQFMQQVLKALAELVTGVSDQTLGRVSDRPNAPQTASGQAMLIQEGNTRVSLDMSMIREDVGRAVNYVWQLEREYGDDEVFFRITGEDAPYDSDRGFGKMTADERDHPYDFQVKFATSFWSREAKKQTMLQIYGLSIQNPLVQTNPRALWVILNRIWESFGEHGFRDVIPEPPQAETPKTPKDEWLLMLKGDQVEVSPLDDDMEHLLDHRRRLENAMQDEPQRRDLNMEAGVVQHVIQHEKQRRQKMLLQAIAAQAVQAMQAGGMMPPGSSGLSAAPPSQMATGIQLPGQQQAAPPAEEQPA